MTQALTRAGVEHYRDDRRVPFASAAPLLTMRTALVIPLPGLAAGR